MAGINFINENEYSKPLKFNKMIDIKLINKYIERVKIDYPEDDKLMIDLQQFAQEAVKNCSIPNISGSTFTNEELQTIKIDILHIYDKVSLSETEVHKRNLILNKLKTLLGDEY